MVPKPPPPPPPSLCHGFVRGPLLWLCFKTYRVSPQLVLIVYSVKCHLLKKFTCLPAFPLPIFKLLYNGKHFHVVAGIHGCKCDATKIIKAKCKNVKTQVVLYSTTWCNNETNRLQKCVSHHFDEGKSTNKDSWGMLSRIKCNYFALCVLHFFKIT